MALEQRRLEKEGSQCNLEIRVQWENRRAEDSLLVLYTPARMFFNCGVIL